MSRPSSIKTYQTTLSKRLITGRVGYTCAIFRDESRKSRVKPWMNMNGPLKIAARDPCLSNTTTHTRQQTPREDYHRMQSRHHRLSCPTSHHRVLVGVMGYSILTITQQRHCHWYFFRIPNRTRILRMITDCWENNSHRLYWHVNLRFVHFWSRGIVALVKRGKAALGLDLPCKFQG